MKTGTEDETENHGNLDCVLSDSFSGKHFANISNLIFSNMYDHLVHYQINGTKISQMKICRERKATHLFAMWTLCTTQSFPLEALKSSHFGE